MIAKYLLIVCLVLLASIIAVINITPPVSRDALIHHLYVPKLWLAQGSIAPIPDIVFSYYPMNLDLLYIIPLALGTDTPAKYIHFFFALLTAWLIFSYLNHRLPSPWALFGSLFFLSIPIIIKLSVTVYVDLGVIFFTTASLLSLFKWAQSQRNRYLIIAGFCCGLAAGTKYNALISVFLLTLFTPLVYLRFSDQKQGFKSLKAILYTFVFVLVTLLAYSPWLVRNYKATGNPIYPLYQSIFDRFATTGHNNQSAEKKLTLNEIDDVGKRLVTRRSSKLAQRKVDYHETWWQSLLLPVRFFFEGRDNDPRYFDGKLSPFLLILMFFAFYHYRYSDSIRTEQWFLLAFGWLFFFFSFFMEALRIRYISPAIPMFSILAVFGLHNIFVRLQSSLSRQLAAVLMLLLLSVPLAYNVKYLWDQVVFYKPLEYLTGKISRDEYLERYLPDYPVQKYAAEHLGADSKLLAVYVGRRGYYFEHHVIFDPVDGRSKLGGIIRKAETAHGISQQIKNLGISHLFIRFDLFSKNANANLSTAQIEMFNAFLAQETRFITSNENYGQHYALFELL